MPGSKKVQKTVRYLRKKVATSVTVLNAIALLTIGVVAVMADIQSQRLQQQNARSDVQTRLSVIRAKLEGNINSNLQLVQGLIITLKTEPEMNQVRFTQLASQMLETHSQLRNVAAAPDMVIRLMYPIKGNEKAIGLDYNKIPAQREAALAVRQGRKPVLAGPVDLVQGGHGFIGRYPVFYSDTGGEHFWGIVSAVIDRDRLYRDSGLLNEKLPIDVAIVGKDSKGANGKHFFGNAAILESRPVVTDVLLPTGSWQLAATPKGGWGMDAMAVWIRRAVIGFGALLLFLPIYFAGRLSEQRKLSIMSLRSREEKLQQVSQRLKLALDVSKVGVWEIDFGTREISWDDRMMQIYGLSPSDRMRNLDDWSNLLHPDDRDRTGEAFREAVHSDNTFKSDFRIVLNGGKIRHVRTTAVIFRDRNNGSACMVGINWDVTADLKMQEALLDAKKNLESRNSELEATKARIEHMAMHDSLTRLPNRRYLDQVLGKHDAKKHDSSRIWAMMVVDLDRFKQINDTFGHAAGDALLIHVSGVLNSLARPSDFVARIGGDEFVIACKSECDVDYLQWLAEAIVEKSRQPLVYNGFECRFGFSIGIASNARGDIDPKQLLINADIALYEAKSNGRYRYEFYSESLQAKTVQSKRLSDEILRGVDRNEFVPHYQPQFDARNHSVVGVEALARWNHPQHGVLSPAQFFSGIEELNIASMIDRKILEQSLEDFGHWERMGLNIPKVSVNVSLQRLHDSELLQNLAKMNIRPGTFAFELIESIFLDENDDVVIRNINGIKQLGIDVEIDDFGTGHTSIISLLKLKPQRLKIDKQLIIPSIHSASAESLARSVIEIGKSLDIEVVAEGVETMKHATMLQRLGCDALQGYAFAKPMPAAELENFVAARMKMSA